MESYQNETIFIGAENGIHYKCANLAHLAKNTKSYSPSPAGHKGSVGGRERIRKPRR